MTFESLFSSARSRKVIRGLVLPLILLLAAGLRIAWALYSEAEPNLDDDSAYYLSIADALAAGDGFVGPDGQPTAWLPPGYPFLLSLVSFVLPGVSIGLSLAQGLNVLLGTLSVLLTFLIAERLFDRSVATVAAILVAILPSHILFTPLVLPEITFTFVALGALLSTITAFRRGATRGRGPALPFLFLAGILFGYAALLQPHAVVLPLLLIPLVAGRENRRLLWTAIPLLAGVLLVVTPWLIRNEVEVGDPGPISTRGGVAFWIGHHEGATGHKESADPLLLGYSPSLDPVEVERLANRDGYREGIEYLLANPLTEFANLFKKLFWIYADDEIALELNDNFSENAFLSRAQRDYFFTLSNAYYYSLLLFGALGLQLSGLGRDRERMVLFIYVAGWTAAHLLLYGDPRAHLPLLPVFAIFAGATVVVVNRVRSAVRQRERDVGALS
jgi:4-amino-4-deoxy-L-arabinose transferase-like glycosyltransferase